MHSGTTPATAVAVFIARVALGTSSRRVLLLLVLFSLSRVTAGRVGGDRMLEVRLGAVHPRFVRANFELAGSGERCAAAPVVILVEGVEVVAAIVLGTTGSFDQRVDHHDQ